LAAFCLAVYMASLLERPVEDKRREPTSADLRGSEVAAVAVALHIGEQPPEPIPPRLRRIGR
jgi:hypothetical protein